MKLFNTLTRKIEEFTPINPPKVGMYTCGPTVHDYQHIGNLRTMIFSDILSRTLKASGFEVTSVRNITDIDDKIIQKAKEKNQSIEEFTNEYTEIFFKDIISLNIESVSVSCKATEHVGHMIKYIVVLVSKGFAYIEKDGSVYFDISKFSEYGKLSQIDKRSLKTGTRILSDEYSKDDVQDFALWKSARPKEVGYDSPWGRGRPGWHIECSVMSQEYLGDSFDIHTGGIDLLFPHHENEIAQSEAKTGKKFVNYFVHAEHLLVNGQKMAKSLNNFFRLKDIGERGFDPLSLRYLFLTAHYRDKLNFTWDSLQAAQHALDHLREEIRAWEQPKGDAGLYWQKFLEAANNDLNMPQAVGQLWEMVRSDTPTSSRARDLLEMDKILGLRLEEYLGKAIEVPMEVQKLLEKRESVRASGDFKESDRIRKGIEKLGYRVLDTRSGPKVKSVIN